MTSTVLPITSLSVLDGDLDHPSRSWCKPFTELLPLLKIVDGSNPKIQGNHRFSFQHSRDLSELSRVFLSVAFSDGVMHEIAIDSIRFDDSDSSPGQAFVAKLRDICKPCLVKEPSKCFSSNLHQATYTPLGKIQGYSDRLIENDIIRDTSPFQEVDLVTCPLCCSPLWSCEECDATVVCSNSDCGGSQVVDCERCVEHECMACRQCLDSKALAPTPSFVRCWTCGSWRCKKDVSW